MAEKIKKLSKKLTAIISLVTLIFSYSLIDVNKSNAGTLTVKKDTLSDSRPTVATVKHSILFRATTVIPLSGKIIIDFPADFDLTGSHTFADMSLKIDASNPPTTSKTLAAAASATDYGVAVDTTNEKITITLCSGACATTANDYILLTIGDGAAGGSDDITNPAAGTYTIALSTTDAANTAIDSGNLMVAIVAGVIVSATVAETLSFSVSDYAIGFGTWTDTAQVRWAAADAVAGATSEPGNTLPSQLTVSTNASGGVNVTIASTGDGGGNAGLYKSAATAKLIAAAASSVVAGSTEGYGVYGKNATGLTIAEAYNNDTVSDSAITTSPTTFVSTTGAVSSGTVDLVIKAAISGSTPAGSYADTLTMIATPTF